MVTDAEHDAVKIARGRGLGDVGAQTVGLDLGVAPGRELGHDARRSKSRPTR